MAQPDVKQDKCCGELCCGHRSECTLPSMKSSGYMICHFHKKICCAGDDHKIVWGPHDMVNIRGCQLRELVVSFYASIPGTLDIAACHLNRDNAILAAVNYGYVRGVYRALMGKDLQEMK